MFTASIASIALVIGLFLKKKTGWILITGWFYFFLFNFFNSLIIDGLPESPAEFLLLLLFLIPIGFIILMNKFDGIKKYHGTENEDRIKLNLFAIGTGIVLVGFRIIKKTLLQQRL